jgi:hypothetical protein
VYHGAKPTEVSLAPNAFTASTDAAKGGKGGAVDTVLAPDGTDGAFGIYHAVTP